MKAAARTRAKDGQATASRRKPEKTDLAPFFATTRMNAGVMQRRTRRIMRLFGAKSDSLNSLTDRSMNCRNSQMRSGGRPCTPRW